MDPCLNPQSFRSHGQFLSFDRERGARLNADGLGADIDAEGEEGWAGVLHADLTAAMPFEWIDDSLPKNGLGKLEDYEASRTVPGECRREAKLSEAAHSAFTGLHNNLTTAMGE
ncbi:hypothetical protein AAF712_010698 [Marasmius tenuissimus]|uniref:Uncharacterized protein n=1 Tax=Marasmius tenuissimus TaxID=585030 RepID=A0ABR2ZMK4_9AGAR